MRHYYLSWAMLLGLAGPLAHGQATAWQPFRPGMVYAFGQAGGPVAHVHTLRVDSAYTTAGGDSVYAFNRLLRPANGTTYPCLKAATTCWARGCAGGRAPTTTTSKLMPSPR